MTYTLSDFSVQIHPTGDGFVVDVTVDHEFNQSGWFVTLEPDNSGIFDNPEELFFKVVERAAFASLPVLTRASATLSFFTRTAPKIVHFNVDGQASVRYEVPSIG